MLTIAEFLKRWQERTGRRLTRQGLLPYLQAGELDGAKKERLQGKNYKSWLIPEEWVEEFNPPERGKYERKPKQNEGE